MSDPKCLPSTPKGKKEPERYTAAWEHGRMVRRIMALPTVVTDFRIMHKSHDSVGPYTTLPICVKLAMSAVQRQIVPVCLF